jgi:hypothetical protein
VPSDALINDLSQAYEFPTLYAMSNSTIDFPVGKKITIAERDAGKGGGGDWYVTPTSTTTPNGVNIIQSTQNPLNSFVLSTKRVLQAAQWGAYADGDFVGTTGVGTDNTAPIQAMINFLVETYSGQQEFKDCGAIQLAAGTYEITGSLTLAPNLSIYGRGVDLTEIQNQAGNTSPYDMLRLPDNGFAAINEKRNRNLSLCGFSINGNDNNTSGNVKTLAVNNALYCWFTNMEFKQAEWKNVELISCSNFFWSNVMIRDGNQSQLYLQDCTNMTFGSSVTIRTGNKWGVEFPAGSLAPSDRISFVGTRFASSIEGGIGCFDDSRSINIQGCSFVEGSSASATFAASIYVENGNSNNWRIINNTFTRVFGRCVDVDGDAAFINGNTIDSCRKDGIVVKGIDCQVSNNYIVDSGYESDNTYDSILIAGQRTQVFGNSILFVNDVSGAGNKPRFGINMTTGSNNGRVYNNNVGSTATNEPLNFVESSVMSYKNSGAPAQLTFVVVGMSTNQTGVGGSTTTVNFDNVKFDKQDDFDGTTSTFTAPTKGYYMFNCTVDTQNVAGNSVLAQISNETDPGVPSLFNVQTGAYEGTMVLQGKLIMEKDDQARIKIQFSGGSGEVNDRSYLQIERADV